LSAPISFVIPSVLIEVSLLIIARIVWQSAEVEAQADTVESSRERKLIK
jgi:hypothetical protein